MERERLCAEAHGLRERGFPLGHRDADRGVRAGQPVESDLNAVSSRYEGVGPPPPPVSSMR